MLRSTLILLLVVGSLGCPRSSTTRGRFLYEVTCEGDIIRFDTVEKKKTAEYDLAQRPGVNGVIPIAQGVVEECLAIDTVFDPVKSVFYTLAPTSLELTPALTRSYRLLTFSVPELTLVAQSSAGENLETPPRLAFVDGMARVIAPGSPWPADLDLSGFTTGLRPIPNRTLEWSGPRLLLSLIEGGQDVLAVADRAAKTLVRLKSPIRLDEADAHLSPGGTHVLLNQRAGTDQFSPLTANIFLYDARSGELVKQLTVPSIVGLYFRAMAPTGVALYQLPSRDELVDLGIRFPAEQVLLPSGHESPLPVTFFADR